MIIRSLMALTASALVVGAVPSAATANWAIANSMGQAGCLPSEVQQAPWVMHVFDEAGYTSRALPMLVLYMSADARGVYDVINSSNPALVKEVIVVTCGSWPLPEPLRSGSHYAPNGTLVYHTPAFHWTLIRQRNGGGTYPIRIYHLRRM